MASNKYQKELTKLRELIYRQRTIVSPDQVIGWYRFMAKVEAIEKILIEKQIMAEKEFQEKQVPILKEMQNDFTISKKTK